MSKAQERRDTVKAIVDEAVAAWNAAGVEYTCLAVIYDVIRPIIQQRCEEHGALSIRWRMCENMAANVIHQNWRDARNTNH